MFPFLDAENKGVPNFPKRVMAAKDLIEALQKRGTSNQHNFTPLKQNALQQLSDIFNEATGAHKITDVTDITIAPDTAAPPRVNKINTSVPRVDENNQPSGSYDATTPDNICNKNYIHQRKTRRNRPMDTIHEINSAPDRLVDTTSNDPPNSGTINDTPKSTTTPRRSPRLLNTLNEPLQISKAAFHQFLGNALETHYTCFFP